MPQFRSVPLEEVLPVKQQRGPSQRAQTQLMYREAVAEELTGPGTAMKVELEEGDKHLTVRNNLKRAADYVAEQMGIALPIQIRRKGNLVLAYWPTDEQLAEIEEKAANRKPRGRKASGKAHTPAKSQKRKSA